MNSVLRFTAMVQRITMLVLLAMSFFSFAIKPSNAEIIPSGDGVWLMIASRTASQDAINLAQQYSSSFPGAVVFQSTNGYFGVSLGWISKANGQALLDSLIVNRLIPDDSYFTNGRRFTIAIWTATGRGFSSKSELLTVSRLGSYSSNQVTQQVAPPPTYVPPKPQITAVNRPGYVTGLSANDSFLALRKGSSPEFGMIAKLLENTRFAVLAAQDDWYQVALPNGMSGWVFGKYVAFGEPQIQRQTAQNTETTNVPEIGPKPVNPPEPSQSASANSNPPTKVELPETVKVEPTLTPKKPQKPIAEQKRVALIIGNSNYANTTVLPNPANDAKAIEAKLSGLGFEIVSGLDTTKAQLELAIRNFVRILPDSDVALFFYAGHGMQVNGNNYIIPVDAKLADSTALDFETIDMQTIINFMNQDNRLTIALLDACRDNPLSRKFSRSVGATRAAFIGRGLAEPKTGSGETLIGYATSPGEVALDGEGKNSPFTTALIKHLDEKGVDIEIMMRNVKSDVYDATDKAQVPWHTSALRREFQMNPE